LIAAPFVRYRSQRPSYRTAALSSVKWLTFEMEDNIRPTLVANHVISGPLATEECSRVSAVVKLLEDAAGALRLIDEGAHFASADMQLPYLLRIG
jgi:hypothetical protein